MWGKTAKDRAKERRLKDFSTNLTNEVKAVKQEIYFRNKNPWGQVLNKYLLIKIFEFVPWPQNGPKLVCYNWNKVIRDGYNKLVKYEIKRSIGRSRMICGSCIPHAPFGWIRERICDRTGCVNNPSTVKPIVIRCFLCGFRVEEPIQLLMSDPKCKTCEINTFCEERLVIQPKTCCHICGQTRLSKHQKRKEFPRCRNCIGKNLKPRNPTV